MKSIFRIVSFIILLSAVISCRSTKKLQTAVNKKDTVITVKNRPASTDSLKAGKDLFAILNSKKIDFKTFSAKIKVEYEDSKGKKPDFTAYVRMKKDSVISISIVGN